MTTISKEQLDYRLSVRHLIVITIFSINKIITFKWSAHGLGKIARTVRADLGIDYLVAETLLNHAMGKLDQAYIHTHIELQNSQALNTYHLWLKKCWQTCFSSLFK